MAARSFANVTLSLGLVNAPVKLFPALSNDKVRFEYCAPDGTPVEQVYRRVDNEQVVGTAADCARSIEGHLVSDDDLDLIKSEGVVEAGIELNKVLSIQNFIPLKAVPFWRVTNCYNVAHDPARGTAESLAIIIKAMEKKKVAAVCKYVPRSSQCLAVVYVDGGRLRLATMSFASSVNELPQESGATDAIKPAAAMVDIASQIIDATYDEGAAILEEMTDTATQAKRELVEKVLQGKAPVVLQPKAAAPATDLMEALQASLRDAQKKSAA